MRRWLPSLAFALICAAPAAALDLPERKAGLWELKMTFEGGNLPPQTVEHCIDAETDKLMSATGGSMVQDMCSKPDVQKTGDTITVDSMCKIGPLRHQSHAVITGDFNSAYTVKVVSKQRRAGDPRDARGADHDNRREVDRRLQGRPEARRHDHGGPQAQRPRSAEHAGDPGAACKAGRAARRRSSGDAVTGAVTLRGSTQAGSHLRVTESELRKRESAPRHVVSREHLRTPLRRVRFP